MEMHKISNLPSIKLNYTRNSATMHQIYDTFRLNCVDHTILSTDTEIIFHEWH